MPGAPLEPPRPGRWRFPLRVHIATLFVALIAAAGLAIVGYGYRATARLLLAAGDEEFHHVAEHTAGQIRNLLTPARLPGRRPRATPAHAGRHPRRAPRGAPAPHRGPGSTSRDLGGLRRLRQRRFLPRPLLERRGPAGPRRAGGGDVPGPERGRFRHARAGTLRLPGSPSSASSGTNRGPITASTPGHGSGTGRRSRATRPCAPSHTVLYHARDRHDPGPAERGGASVVGADITLRELSRHLARTRLTPSARLALVDRQGRVIAHPDAERLARPGPGGGPGSRGSATSEIPSWSASSPLERRRREHAELSLDDGVGRVGAPDRGEAGDLDPAGGGAARRTRGRRQRPRP